jgi:hypothetical protein
MAGKKMDKNIRRQFHIPQPGALMRTGVALDSIGKIISEKHLIVLKKKSLYFISALLFLFVILVVFKIHYSSVAIWDTIVTEYDSTKSASKVIFSSPKFIRMDEWRMATPFILSQAAHNFPVENYSLGPGKVPVLMGLPSFHFSNIFQPQNWGFFILDIERGFSYYWNYGIVGLLVSSFLLFMLLTNSNIKLSVFGSLFLFFSSFIQWWSSLGVLLTAFNGVLIAFICLIVSKKRLIIILSAVALFFFTINFSLAMYPPFQVPLALLMIACLVGYFIQNPAWDTILQHIKLRSCLLVVCIIALIIFAYFFYADLKGTIAQAMNTVYPGKRISTGGGFGIDRLFSGFYGCFFDEKRYIWMNICETSGFLFLFPAIILAVIVNAIKGKNEPLQIALSVYLVFLTFFVIVGFLPAFSKLTLLTFVPSHRAIIGLGLGTIILMVVYLNSKSSSLQLKANHNAFIFIFVLLCFVAYGLYLNAKTNNYFHLWQIGIVSVFFSLSVCLLLNHKKFLFCCIFLSFVVLSTYSVRPISRGLGYIFDKKLYHVVKDLVVKDPTAIWLCYGSYVHSGFVVATGAKVFNGTKYFPDIPAMRILDPSKNNDSIYNRFANIVIVNQSEIDKVYFKLFYDDSYGIAISPFSEKLKKLHIKYLLMPDDPNVYNVEAGKNKGIVPILNKPIDNFWILEIVKS